MFQNNIKRLKRSDKKNNLKTEKKKRKKSSKPISSKLHAQNPENNAHHEDIIPNRPP